MDNAEETVQQLNIITNIMEEEDRRNKQMYPRYNQYAEGKNLTGVRAAGSSAPVAEVVSANNDNDNENHRLHLHANAKKRRGNLPKKAITILLNWLHENRRHAYPNESQKEQLAKAANLTLMQVNNWFINARRRILPQILQKEKENPDDCTVLRRGRKTTEIGRDMQTFTTTTTATMVDNDIIIADNTLNNQNDFTISLDTLLASKSVETRNAYANATRRTKPSYSGTVKHDDFANSVLYLQPNANGECEIVYEKEVCDYEMDWTQESHENLTKTVQLAEDIEPIETMETCSGVVFDTFTSRQTNTKNLQDMSPLDVDFDISDIIAESPESINDKDDEELFFAEYIEVLSEDEDGDDQLDSCEPTEATEAITTKPTIDSIIAEAIEDDEIEYLDTSSAITFSTAPVSPSSSIDFADRVSMLTSDICVPSENPICLGHEVEVTMPDPNCPIKPRELIPNDITPDETTYFLVLTDD